MLEKKVSRICRNVIFAGVMLLSVCANAVGEGGKIKYELTVNPKDLFVKSEETGAFCPLVGDGAAAQSVKLCGECDYGGDGFSYDGGVERITGGKPDRLSKIVLPGSVKTVGLSAFGGCANLQEVEFSEGVETVGREAFSGCGELTEVKFPGSLKRLVGGAFESCSKLESVEFLSSATTVSGDAVFKECPGLERVRISIKAEGGSEEGEAYVGLTGKAFEGCRIKQLDLIVRSRKKQVFLRGGRGVFDEITVSKSDLDAAGKIVSEFNGCGVLDGGCRSEIVAAAGYGILQCKVDELTSALEDIKVKRQRSDDSPEVVFLSRQ